MLVLASKHTPGPNLVQRQPTPDEAQQALACFGAVEQGSAQVYLYFSHGQPNSAHTAHYLASLLEVARSKHKRVAVVIWDHASWHKSKQVRSWVREHNQHAKAHGDVRLLTFLLPKKSPWLNPSEPRWVHAKRQVCEPDGKISPEEMERRLCAHFDTQPLVPPLKL
jgi:hypothetical protein